MRRGFAQKSPRGLDFLGSGRSCPESAMASDEPFGHCARTVGRLESRVPASKCNGHGRSDRSIATMLSDLWDFVWAILAWWWIYMTAIGPFVIDEVLKKLAPAWWKKTSARISEPTRRKVEVAFMVFGLLVSAFLVWRDEHTGRVRAEGAQARAEHFASEALAGHQPDPRVDELMARERQRLAREWPALTEQQIAEWETRLGSLQAPKPIAVFYDDGSQGLRAGIAQVFHERFQVELPMVAAATRNPGISIRSQPGDPEAEVLARLFHEYGTEPQRGVAPSATDLNVYVDIGVRPTTGGPDVGSSSGSARSAGKSPPGGTSP